MALHVGLDTLTQDAAPFGTLQAPLLSWLGAAGLLTLCLWQTSTFLWRSGALLQALQRFSSTLQTIVQERRGHTTQAAEPDPWTSRFRSAAREVNSRDLQDVHRLQTMAEQEPLLAEAWTSYRHTLATDPTPWYADPRLFSSQPAKESFAIEPLLTDRVNLPSYQHLPALLTGLGLLMTFVALLIGLSHLHADGGTILGIQGLVNGLAGKFLTSIVGLACAHAATFVEKRAVFRLAALHRTCEQHLDRLFPRIGLHDWQNGYPTVHGHHTAAPISRPSGYAPASTSPARDTLTQPIMAMTQAVTTLSQDLRAVLAEKQRPHEAEPTSQALAELSPLLNRLTHAVEALTQQFTTPKTLPTQPDPTAEHLAEHLLTRLQSSQPVQRKAQSWLRPIRALEQAWRS